MNTVPLFTNWRTGQPMDVGAGDLLYARNYGVLADGSTDDTVALQAAITAALALGPGTTVQLPEGTLIVAGVVLQSTVIVRGYGRGITIVKLKNGANVDVFLGQNAYSLFGSGSGAGIYDWGLRDMTIDGNSANNTSGNCLAVYGYRWNIENVVFQNAPLNWIHSDWTGAVPSVGVNMEAHMHNVLGVTAGQHGFNFLGPHDSNFESVIAVDASQSANNTYYGMYFGASMNARVSAYHGWHTASVSNRTLAQFYTDGSGSDFSDSQFEGSYQSPLQVNTNSTENNFYSCKAFSAWNGGPQVVFRGPENNFHGWIGPPGAGRPSSTGIALGFGSDNASYCNIDAIVHQNTLGAVDFTHSAGNNRVRIVGFSTSGTGYTGTPAASDDVWLNVQGGASSNQTLFQLNETLNIIPTWSTYTPTITAGTGTFTTVSASGRFINIGKLTFVNIAITITTNGTAATSVNATLPNSAKVESIIYGREDGVSGKMVQAKIAASGSAAIIFNYDNTYPGASGALIIMSGSYENL